MQIHQQPGGVSRNSQNVEEHTRDGAFRVSGSGSEFRVWGLGSGIRVRGFGVYSLDLFGVETPPEYTLLNAFSRV